MNWTQLIILCTGVPAAWLSQIPGSALPQYACLFALVGQPFWIRATWKSRQWGMLLLTIAYTGAWMYGLWNFWIKGWI